MDNDIDLNISISQIEAAFRRASSVRYDKEIDFTPITNELSKLKNGGRLKYEHLELIADPNIWPFHTWWRFPEESQIRDGLSKTEERFVLLKDLPQNHDEREGREKEIIRLLYYDVFKHIELVSIVLRFIDEENYAIYSPPVAHLTNSPRGFSYGSELLNYLGEIRKWRDIYELEKAAYVDMFLWAIEVLGENREEIWELFHHKVQEDQRRKIVQNMIGSGVINKSDKERAVFYSSIQEYDTAAKWAGCSFEGVIRNKCSERGIPLNREDGTKKTMGELVNEYPRLNSEEKRKIIELRNNTAHASGYRFSESQIKFMLKLAKKVGGH